MKKVLVTGDRGYIGSVLVPLLIKNNYEVVGYDTDFFKTRNSAFSKYKQITKDIRKITMSDIEGIDAIIHLCALSNDPMGDLDPTLTDEINFKSSVRLAKMAKKAGIKRFLFSSSCSIYGIAKSDIVDEESEVNPLTAYAKSKIDTEKALQELSDKNFIIGLFRNSTVYGYSPNFRNDLVVNNLVTTALAFGEIRILSDGTPWRPLIDVRDLCSIFIKFLSSDGRKINGNIINIGFDENNLQVKDIVAKIKKAVPGCRTVFTGEHGKDTRSYKVSFAKFQKIYPKIVQKWNIDKSIYDLVSRLKKNKFSKTDFESGRYTRLQVLSMLRKTNQLTEKLFWRKE